MVGGGIGEGKNDEKGRRAKREGEDPKKSRIRTTGRKGPVQKGG